MRSPVDRSGRTGPVLQSLSKHENLFFRTLLGPSARLVTAQVGGSEFGKADIW